MSIEVYSPGLVLGAAYSGPSGSSSVTPSELKVANVAPHRYTLSSTAMRGAKQYILSFSDETSEQTEQTTLQVSIPLNADRTLRRRQWRQVRAAPSGKSGKDSRGSLAAGSSARAYEVMQGSQRWIVVLPIANTADWMGSMPDSTRLGDLTIPGTHESCALYGYPISQCQQPSTDISQQLLDGVRYLDVRLRAVGNDLLAYHGPRPERSTVKRLLETLHDFLTSHPTETVILCLKEETPPSHPIFSELVYQHFQPYRDEWFFENRIPELHEVRGKGILMTRFEAVGGSWAGRMGIHPTTWPDSRKEGFTWDCAGTPFRIQDWYRVQSFLEIPEKLQAVIDHVAPTLNADPAHPFSLSYTSASNFPLSLPTTIAKGIGWPDWGMGVYGINQRLAHWLLLRLIEGQRVRACLAMDFYRQCGDDRGLAALLVSMNFV